MQIHWTFSARSLGVAAGSLGLACGLLVAPASVSAAPPTGPTPSVYRPLSSNAPAPSITGLDRSIGRLTRSASLGSFSMLVVDPVSEKPVFSDQVNKARTPASVSKLLTAAAALLLMSGHASGQSAGSSEVPRTADGRPDLSGVWANNAAT